MSKQCIGCKREIAWGSTDCPFCGSSQSRIKLYLRPVLFILLVITVVYAGGKTWHQQQIRSAVTDAKRQAEQTISQLEQSLSEQRTATSSLNEQVMSLKDQLNTKLKSQQSASASAEEQIAELNRQLKASQEEVDKQRGRAGWLTKERTRLEAEIEQLKQQLATLQANQSPSTTPQNTTNTNANNQSSSEDGGNQTNNAEDGT